MIKGKINVCYCVVVMLSCNDRKVLIEGWIGSFEEKFVIDSMSLMVGWIFKDLSYGYDFDEGEECKNLCRCCGSCKKSRWKRRMCCVFGKMLMRF